MAPPGTPPAAWPDAPAFSSLGSGLASGGGEVGFDMRSMWSQSGSGDKEALMLIPLAFLLIAKLLLRGPMIRIPFENLRR